MRILVDIASIGSGGAERQLLQVLSGLQARGHDLRLVVNKTVDGYIREYAEAPFSIAELRRHSKWDPRVLTDLLRESSAHRSDVVLAVNFNATLWGRLGAILRGTAVVTAEHSAERGFRFPLWATNRLLGLGTASVIACGAGQVDPLVAEGNPRYRLRIVENGVDAAEFEPKRHEARAFRDDLGLRTDDFVVGIVAGHRPEKRHDRFIELIETVSDEGTHGVMIGGGAGIGQTRLAAESSSAKDRLHIVGHVKDMAAAYSACDVVVLVSDSEAFPLCFLEAQACATPVIGMQSGGIAGTMQPGVSGVMVQQGDVAGMATAVTALRGDRSRRLAMGRAGRDFVMDRFAVDRMIDAYEDILASACGIAERADAASATC